MVKQLSILIPTLPQRLEKYALLLNNLSNQIKINDLTDSVQLLSIMDCKDMSVGEKRNWLLQMSCGKYVQFLDDDDRISNDFVKKMHDATLSEPDVVTFKGEFYHSGKHHSDFLISTMVRYDTNKNGMMYRRPNHLCPVKREIALNCKFPNKNYGEDSDYANQINNIIKTEKHIDDKLYFYMFDEIKSETHKHRHEK